MATCINACFTCFRFICVQRGYNDSSDSISTISSRNRDNLPPNLHILPSSLIRQQVRLQIMNRLTKIIAPTASGQWRTNKSASEAIYAKSSAGQHLTFLEVGILPANRLATANEMSPDDAPRVFAAIYCRRAGNTPLGNSRQSKENGNRMQRWKELCKFLKLFF